MVRASGYYKAPNSASWIKDPQFVMAKILCGLCALAYREKNPDMGGWYSERVRRRLSQRVSDQIPGVKDRFAEQSKTSVTFDMTLAGRGAVCLPCGVKDGKDELRRFRVADFAHTWDAGKRAFQDGTFVLHHDEILDLQARRLILRAPHGPCMYLRHTPDLPRQLYVGSAQCAEDRDRGHKNAPHHLVQIYSFRTEHEAQGVEKAVQSWLREKGAYPLREGTRGLFVTAWDDPHVMVDVFVQTTFKFLIHNTAEECLS
jgi:hypothetical protein